MGETRHEREERETADYAGRETISTFMGWPIFGGWLPMLRFFDVPCEADGGAWDGQNDPGWRARVFAVGWLNRALSITCGAPRHVRVLRRP